MTKKEAKAILACRKAIIKLLDDCEKKLEKGSIGEGELPYMQAYWGASIRSTIDGQGYGAAPIGKAMEKIGE